VTARRACDVTGRATEHVIKTFFFFFFFEVKARPKAWPSWDTSSMYYKRKPNATQRMT
jgi:hypothetical protein